MHYERKRDEEIPPIVRGVYICLAALLPFVTIPYVSRILGPSGIGTFSLYSSIARIFALVSMLGLQVYGARAISRCLSKQDTQDALDETFSGLFRTHLLVCGICWFGYAVYLHLVTEERIYALTMLPVVISAALDISWVYFGLGLYSYPVFCGIVSRFLEAVCVFAFVRTSGDLWKYCLIRALAVLFNQAILWIRLDGYVGFVPVKWKRALRYTKPLLVFFLPAAIGSARGILNRILIGVCGDRLQLGFYENADQLTAVSVTAVFLLMGFLLSARQRKDKDQSIREGQAKVRFALTAAIGTSLFLAFLFLTAGKSISSALWGSAFVSGAGALRILSLSIPLQVINGLFRLLGWIPTGQDRNTVVYTAVSITVNAVLDLLFIPSLGASGAAIGQVCADTIVCLIQFLKVRRYADLKERIRSGIRKATLDGQSVWRTAYNS